MKASRLRLLLIGLALLGVFLVWLPFYLRVGNLWGLNFSGGMMTVWANFDGPNYLIIARTWYDKSLIASVFSTPLLLEYYPAHWPLYPAVIVVLQTVIVGPWAMLIAGLLGVALFYWVLIKFLTGFGVPEKKAFWLALISLVLPARWIVVRSVGSPEAWFGAFVMLSLLAYKDKRYLLAGVWGGLAQLTKSPAILLFLSYGVFEVLGLIKGKRSWGELIRILLQIGLIPLAVLLVFTFYFFRTGDFWAYFHSGDNFHLFWPPFSIFGKGGVWVGDFWLEEIIWLWLIYGLGIWRLLKQKLIFVFGLVFFISTLFVSHRDLSRYILPLMPLLLLGWQKVLLKAEAKWIVMLLILPSLLFAWNFILNNTAPIADWTPYL